MKLHRFTFWALIAIIFLGVLPLRGVCSESGTVWQGYSLYQGPWPAGPFYQVVQLTYGDLNPLNQPNPIPDAYWPYPSPFVMFSTGIQLDPLNIPLTTPGTNYGIGSMDGKIYQQYASFDNDGTKYCLYTIWILLKIGPAPLPGEVLPPYVYYQRPYPDEGVGNYYLIFNEYIDDCNEAGASPHTIGYWKNWDNHYSPEEMQNLLQIAKGASSIFANIDINNLSSVIQNKKEMSDRARSQMIATWLSILSGRVNIALYVNVSGIPNWNTVLSGSADGRFTINSVVSQIEAKMVAGNLTATQWEAIKSISDAINNEQIFIK